MQRAVSKPQEHESRDQRARDISRLLQQAQLLCQDAKEDARDDASQRLFVKIGALLDDVIAVLARYEPKRESPKRPVH